MNRQEMGRFAAVLARLSKISPCEIDVAFAEMYFEALYDLPMDAVEGGAKILVREARQGDYYPKPGDMRVAARRWLEGRRSLDAPSPEQVEFRRLYDARYGQVRRLPPPSTPKSDEETGPLTQEETVQFIRHLRQCLGRHG